MEVKAANSAAPGVSGVFITANSIVSGSSTEQEFSGMLDAQIVIDNQAGKLTTSVSNNTGGNSATFAALNNMYFSLDSDRQNRCTGCMPWIKLMLQRFFANRKWDAAGSGP